MGDVSDIHVDANVLHRARPPRGQRLYGLLLDTCRLIHENLRPDESGGGYELRDFTRDDGQMATLFQDFVRNFLRRELHGVHVKRDYLAWAGATGSPNALAWLPRMETDVSLVTEDARTIIETKFYRQPFEQRFDKRKLRSGHLFQLFAYLKNTQANEPLRKVGGILLYASVGESVSASLQLDELSVSVRTLDLAAPWEDLRTELLALALPWAHSRPSRKGDAGEQQLT